MPAVGTIIKNKTREISPSGQDSSTIRDMKKSSTKLNQHKFNEQVKNMRDRKKYNLENTERVIEEELQSISNSIYEMKGKNLQNSMRLNRKME